MSTTRAVAQSDIDLFDDDILVDPYPTFATLRETAAVVHLPHNDVYALTRYDAIRDALADHETVLLRRRSGSTRWSTRRSHGTSLASDPPEHTRLRAALTENLTPRALRGLRAQIEAKADALVADLVEQGSFEAIDSLARALPLEVVADLIGFTGEVRDNMLRWGQAAMQVIGPMNQRTAENFPIAGELYALVLAGHRRGPGSRARSAAASSTPRRAGTFRRTPPATSSTSTSAPASTPRSPRIGNIVALFAAHPDQFARVRQDHSLVPAAFNEVLRYWIPLHAWGRSVTRDVEIDGALIPAGAQVALPASEPATGTRATTTIPTRSWSSATRWTTSRSATARTAAQVRGWPVSRRTPSSTPLPAGRAPRRRRGRAGAEQHDPEHRRAPRASRWCRHEDRGGPTTVRGPRPVRGGSARAAAPRRRGRAVIDRDEVDEGSARCGGREPLLRASARSPR